MIIDGRQLTGTVRGGVQRYLSEILAELDKIAEPGEYEILIPEKTDILSEYTNIGVVKYGKLQGLLW